MEIFKMVFKMVAPHATAKANAPINNVCRHLIKLFFQVWSIIIIIIIIKIKSNLNYGFIYVCAKRIDKLYDFSDFPITLSVQIEMKNFSFKED